MAVAFILQLLQFVDQSVVDAVRPSLMPQQSAGGAGNSDGRQDRVMLMTLTGIREIQLAARFQRRRTRCL